MKEYEILATAIQDQTPCDDPVGAARKIENHLRGKYPTATALVLFVNHDFNSSAFGSWTVLAVGPDCTYKSIAQVEGCHLNDLPSQRQYPVGYTTLK